MTRNILQSRPRVSQNFKENLHVIAICKYVRSFLNGFHNKYTNQTQKYRPMFELQSQKGKLSLIRELPVVEVSTFCLTVTSAEYWCVTIEGCEIEINNENKKGTMGTSNMSRNL